MKVIILALVFLGVVAITTCVLTAMGMNNAKWEQLHNDK